MVRIICQICGGMKQYVQGDGWVCQSCGSHTYGEKLSDILIDKLDEATSLRNRYFFDESLNVCNEILKEEPENQEANWCALLAEYKIVYLQNDKGDWTPTFLEPDANPVPIDKSKYAAKLNRVQRDEVREIEEKRQRVVAEGSKIPPYDVFICYKQHTNGSNGSFTDEEAWAEKFYRTLAKKNKLRVFLGHSVSERADWEAHIFAAIRSAKYMVVFGSSIDDIDSPWVKNEWMRFAYMQKRDRTKILRTAVPYSRIRDRRRLDEKLRNTQVIDIDSPDWEDELVNDILSVVNSSVNPVQSLLLKAEEFIRHGKFKKAKSVYEEIINREPKNVDALWGLIRCKYKAFDDYDIIKSRKMLDEYAGNEFGYVIAAGDDGSDKKYYKIKEDQIRHDTQNYGRPNYSAFRKNRRPKRILKISAAVVCIAAVFAFVALFTPTVTDKTTGVFAKADNKSFGLFGKYSVELSVEEYGRNDQTYTFADEAVGEVANLSCVYGISYGKEPQSEVELNFPVPDDLNGKSIAVYVVNSDGTYEEIECSEAGETITVRTALTGIFAVAEKPCILTFDSDGGENGIFTQKVPCGNSGTTPAPPQKEGYTFLGWFDGENEFDFLLPVTADKTLLAHWAANDYTINYVLDGQEYGQDTVTFDSQVVLKSKVGYNVVWSYEGTTVSDGNWRIASDCTLVGVSEPITLSVTLDCGFSACCAAVSGGSSSVSLTYDAQSSTVLSVPERTGYIFGGYYTSPDGQGTQYFEADGSCSAVWRETQAVLYAKWEKDAAYTGYTYVSTADELRAISSNTTKNYLIVNDIDLDGSNWTTITSFSGIIDGGCHSIYNFTVVSSQARTDMEQVAGLVGCLNDDGVIKNLQIGKSDYTTSLSITPWAKDVFAGMFVGYCGGTLENCRAVNCSLFAKVSAQENTYNGRTFTCNLGAVCGVARGAEISRCAAIECEVHSESWVKYNNISAMVRAGGIVGYTDNIDISNCLVKNCTVKADAVVDGGAWANRSGQPYARGGGLVADCNSSRITNCAVVSNGVSASKTKNKGEANYFNGDGNYYQGSLFGCTSSTTPTDNVSVGNSSMQFSGSNSSYDGCSTLSSDSYNELTAKFSTFNNGYWDSDSGMIALKFYS